MSAFTLLFSAPCLPFTVLALTALTALAVALALSLSSCRNLKKEHAEATREALRLTETLSLEKQAHAERLETVNSLRDSLERESARLTEAYAQLSCDAATLEHLNALKSTLEEEVRRRDTRIDELIGEREDLSASNLRLTGEMRALTALKEQEETHQQEARERLEQTLSALKNELLEKEGALSESETRNAALKAENLALKTALDHTRTSLETEREAQSAANRSLEERLKLFSEEMLRQRSAELNLSSREEFERAVTPLKNELEQFRSLILKTQQSSSEQSGALKTELLKLHATHVAVSERTEELISALRGGRKSQGMWGEHQLELCLEAAGLTEGQDYLREVAGNRTLNERGRPDVIVRLPKDHCLIIDAKCSLTAYTDYVNAGDAAARGESMKRHLASLKAHIAELAAKRYDSYQSFNSPSFVFMFVPVDGALTEALSASPSLYAQAEKDGVYLVSPSPLIPALRVVAQLWVLSRQNEHIAAIAAEAESLYKKALTVSSYLERIKKNYHALGDSVDDLDRSLLSGKGNLLASLERFSTRAPRYVALAESGAPAKAPLNDSPVKVLKPASPPADGNAEVTESAAPSFPVSEAASVTQALAMQETAPAGDKQTAGVPLSSEGSSGNTAKAPSAPLFFIPPRALSSEAVKPDSGSPTDSLAPGSPPEPQADTTSGESSPRPYPPFEIVR